MPYKEYIYNHINNFLLNSSNFTKSTKHESSSGVRAWEFYEYSLLLLCIFGTIGNILSIIIMRSQRMRNTNAAFFVTCMALSDIFVLLIKFISVMLKMYKITIFSNCIYLELLASSFAYTSVWLVIIISIERYIAVLYPLKVAIIFSKRKVKIIILLMAIFFVILSSIRSFCTTIHEKPPHFCTDVKNRFCINYNNKIYPWIKSTLLSWLPSFLGATLNIIIIVELFKASKNRKNITNTSSSIKMSTNLKMKNNVKIAPNEKNYSSPNKEKQITIMLLTISIAFVIFTFPYAVYELWRKVKVGSSKSKQDKLNQRIVMILFDLNHSMNFVFYCLTAKRFRDELKRIFFCEKKNRKNTSASACYHHTYNLNTTTNTNIRKDINTNKHKDITNSEYLNQNDLYTEIQ